jgi:hypothetical protein
MLGYIAEICNSAPGTGMDDITGFFGPSFLPIRWRYLLLKMVNFAVKAKFFKGQQLFDFVKIQ